MKYLVCEADICFLSLQHALAVENGAEVLNYYLFVDSDKFIVKVGKDTLKDNLFRQLHVYIRLRSEEHTSELQSR